MKRLLVFAVMLMPFSATAEDDNLIALAKYAVRQRLKTEDLAFKDIYVSEIYHLENNKRVHRGNTMCGKVNGKWFQVVTYEYAPAVEVYLGLDDKEGLPCYEDVQLENPIEISTRNTEAVREQEWKEQSLRNIQAAETELADRLAQERKENAEINR